MHSIISYPDRGKWGDSTWRGNCSGYVVRDLIELLKPSSLVDPTVGSGTSYQVGTEKGLATYGLDLHSGFNVVRDPILNHIPHQVDLGLIHPPYAGMITYSGNVWGDSPHPDDLSHVKDDEEFCELLHLAMLNLRDATKAGKHFALLIGDYRKDGQYHSYQADMISRLPKRELKSIIIKHQHNVSSNKNTYRCTYPLIMHEYLILWQKNESLVSYFDLLRDVAVHHKVRIQTTWKNVVRFSLMALGGEAKLTDIYDYVWRHKQDKTNNNPQHWKDKVRQVLNTNDAIFNSKERGVWRLN